MDGAGPVGHCLHHSVDTLHDRPSRRQCRRRPIGRSPGPGRSWGPRGRRPRRGRDGGSARSLGGQDPAPRLLSRPRQAGRLRIRCRPGDQPQRRPVRLSGAPRCHHATAPSAASFPRNLTRGSLMVPDMPPPMELLPRLPRQQAVAADEAKTEAAAARATARGAAERVRSYSVARAEREDEGRQGAAATLSDEVRPPGWAWVKKSSPGRPSSGSAQAALGWST